MMASLPEICDAMATDDPDTLFNLCMNYIIKQLNIITERVPDSTALRLKNKVILPYGICERFLEAYQLKRRMTDDIANMFRDRSHTHLTALKLHNARVSDKGLLALLEHKPRVLELVNCEIITPLSLDYINAHSENLVSLKIGPITDIIPNNNMRFHSSGYMFNTPKLRQLTVRRRGVSEFPLHRLGRLTLLTHLDMSDCTLLSHISCLTELKHLQVLILHNVYWLQDVTKWIVTITSLRYLDISQSDNRYGKYNNANKVLAEIATKLPNLEGLDISGTNLAGPGSWTDTEGIAGLASRTGRPLLFLGLCGTHNDACRRRNIPALRIAGDTDENQILNAAEAYVERPEMLSRALTDLYKTFRNDNNRQVMRALDVLLQGMDKNVKERHIQITASATLFYIMKSGDKVKFNTEKKRRIIQVLLKGMETHITVETMMRNGCLTLCQFKIPADVIFEYERIVMILIYGVSDLNQEVFVQRVSIYLLNSLACQVDGQQKRFLGNIGVMTTMLQLITDRLEHNVCDDVLEVAWSTMWNVTDETPENSRRFLNSNGLGYFLACLRNFSMKEDLLRNMMGLLGNVAEVKYLRYYLTTPILLKVFYDLLFSSGDGIEVSYNAAGVLAHIASDGPAAWTVNEPARHRVLQRVTHAIYRWNIKTERNINYRSFEPILSLLSVYHTPQCQHWAVWALANLTTVYPERYCSLVESEGGVQLLQALASHPEPYEHIRELATLVLHNCAAHRQREPCAGELSAPASPDNCSGRRRLEI